MRPSHKAILGFMVALLIIVVAMVPHPQAMGRDEMGRLRGGNPLLPSKCSRSCDNYNGYTCVGKGTAFCIKCSKGTETNQYPLEGQITGCSIQAKGWTLDTGNTIDCGVKQDGHCKNDVCVVEHTLETPCNDPTEAKSQ
jgi:hypothetical protein